MQGLANDVGLVEIHPVKEQMERCRIRDREIEDRVFVNG